MHSYSTPWKHQKTVGSFMFYGVEKICIGNKLVDKKHKLSKLWVLPQGTLFQSVII